MEVINGLHNGLRCSRGGAFRAGGGGEGGGLRSVVCDNEGGFGCGVLDGVAVEGDEVLCAARRCVVASRWAADLDPSVGGRRWGDGGLEAAVAGSRRPNHRSPQEYGEFQLQLRSCSGSEKTSGLTRRGRNRDARGGRWGDDGWPASQTRRSASEHGGLLGAGRRFGDVVESRDVADRNSARRVDGEVLDKAGDGRNAL